MVEACDALFVNYYAVDLGTPGKPATYNVFDPATYEKDFADLLALPSKYGLEKPIVLQEVGMPTDAILGGSELKQEAFVKFVFEQWDKAGVLIPFLSWFQLYDFLYDEKLKVELQGSSIVVTQNTPPYPKTFTYYGVEVKPFFWGTGNELAWFFRPFNPNAPPPTIQDYVNGINESRTGGNQERLCRFLSTCGLVRENGERKLAWQTHQKELAKRRRQT
jgi:hypothetical protein